MESSTTGDEWVAEIRRLKEEYLKRQTLAKTLHTAAQAAQVKAQVASQEERKAETALLKAVIPEAFNKEEKEE